MITDMKARVLCLIDCDVAVYVRLCDVFGSTLPWVVNRSVDSMVAVTRRTTNIIWEVALH